MNPKLYALLSKLSYEDNAALILNKGKIEFLKDEWERNPEVYSGGRVVTSHNLQDSFESYEEFENKYLSTYRESNSSELEYISDFLRKKDEYILLDGYTVIDSERNDETGYFGLAIKKPDGNVIIAHEGSEGNPLKGDFWKDWMGNNRNFVGKDTSPPPQLKDANLLVERVMDENENVVIEQTGHSLGGALAQLSAHEYGNQKAITFDAPGVKKWIENNESNGSSLHEDFESYIATGSWATDTDKRFTFKTSNPRAGLDPDNKSIESDTIEIDLSLLKNHAGNVQRIDLYLPDEEITVIDVIPTHEIGNFTDAFDEQGRIIKSLENPLYVEKLLRKRWNENHQSSGRIYTTGLHDKYDSFDDYKSHYLDVHKDELSINVSHDRLLIQEQETEQFMKDMNIDLSGENEAENLVEINTSHILSQIETLNAAINNI